MFDFLLRYPFFYNLSKLQKDEAAALRVLHGFTENVIRRRRQQLSNVKLGNDDSSNDDDGVRKKRAFLDVLLQSTIDGKPLNDLEIREEVDTFLFEALEIHFHSHCFFLKVFISIQRATIRRQQESRLPCTIWPNIQPCSKNVSTKSVMCSKRTKINHQLFTY